MRLIDGDELLERMKSYYKFYRKYCDADARSDEMIASQAEVVNSPTVEAIPVWWLEEQQNKCSTLLKKSIYTTIIDEWRKAENEV